MVFLGRDLGEQRDYSDAVALEIDREVQRLVNEAYTQAKQLLTEHHAELDAVAQRLIEVETIEEDEFKKFFREPSATDGTPFHPRAKMPSANSSDGSAAAGAVPAPAPA